MENKFGIYDLTHCSTLDYKTRIDIYKKIGFQEIALYLDQNYMQGDENYLDIIKYVKDCNLKIGQVHLDYKNANMICDEASNEYFEYLHQKALECENLSIPRMVIHSSRGFNPPEISDVQLEKIKSLAKKHKNILFCFENLKNITNLEKILNLDIPNIKMCYDIGHANAYCKGQNLLEKFKDKIACSHLHNNFGQDDHNILTNGEIDYLPIIKQLNALPDTSNCIEAFPDGENLTTEQFTKFVSDCYKSVQI